MKNRVIDKQLIEGIIRANNNEFVEKVNDKINYIVSNAVNDLSKQIAYVSLENVIFQPVNELLSGGFTDNSKFIYFLGVDSAQLELNTHKATTFWKDLKNKIVFAWKNRNTRRHRRRRKKQVIEQSAVEQFAYEFDPSRYNIYSLCEDLQTAVAKFCDATTIVYLEGDRIRIVGKEDFGSNTQIIIYPVIFNGEMFKYYTGRKRGFLDIDIFARVDFLNDKYEKVGDNFFKIIKIFNVLYYFANKAMPNQIFIESLLYSCPDELFKGDDIYTVFVKVLNYLTMTSIKNIPSLTNPDKTIFTDKLSASSGLGYEKFINQFVYLNQKEKADPKVSLKTKIENNLNKSKTQKTTLKRPERKNNLKENLDKAEPDNQLQDKQDKTDKTE